MECGATDLICQLDRIADALNGWDWNNLVGTFVATVAGGLVAAAVALWVNARERPRPHWRVEASAPSRWMADADGKVQVRVDVTNIGDGAAYNPSVQPLGVRGGALEAPAVVSPGEMLGAYVRVVGSGSVRRNFDNGKLIDERSVEWPSGTKVLVKWQEPPRRKKVRRQTIRVDPPLSANASAD